MQKPLVKKQKCSKNLFAHSKKLIEKIDLPKLFFMTDQTCDHSTVFQMYVCICTYVCVVFLKGLFGVI